MKILLALPDLYNPHFKGGIQVFNNFLIRALRELDLEIRVVSMNDRPQDVDVSWVYPANENRKKKFKFVFRLIREVFFFRPHLILCGHAHFSPLCLFLKRLLGIPYFTITHGVEVWNIRGIYRTGLANSQRIISVSSFTQNRILNRLKAYPREKTGLLPNTFDSHRFCPGEYPTHLAQKWGISREDTVVLTIARLSAEEQYKGYDRIIEILPRLKKEIGRLKYILVGSGDDQKRVEKLIEERGIKDSVILPGFVAEKELVDFYRLCDLFVMPSKGEGFGIVFLEALGCGKPVVAGNKDGSSDALRDGELGALIDPDNLEELEEAILRALKEKINPEKLQKAVWDYFGFPTFRKKVKGLIESVPFLAWPDRRNHRV